MRCLLVKANDTTAAHRRIFFDLRGTDGITPQTGEANGQPQIAINGGAWTNTGIGLLTSVGNGRYYADLTQTVVATAGTLIETRYKSANTAECPGDSVQVVAFDPNIAFSGTAAAGTPNGLATQDANGRVATYLNLSGYVIEDTGTVEVAGSPTFGVYFDGSGSPKAGDLIAATSGALNGQVAYVTAAAFGGVNWNITVAPASFAAVAKFDTIALMAATSPDNADITTALGDLVALLARTDPTTALAAVKAVTDKVATAIEDDPNNAGKSRLTAAAMAEVPAPSAASGNGSLVVKVNVTDSTRDLQNVDVTLSQNGTAYSSPTDSSGLASFSMLQGTYLIGATLGGYLYRGGTGTLDSDGTWRETGNDTLYIAMIRQTSAGSGTSTTVPGSVRVLSLSTGIGVPGVLVRATPAAGVGPVIEVTTDGDGSGVLDGMSRMVGYVVSTPALANPASVVAIPPSSGPTFDVVPLYV
jgi:hypothetical protein